MASEASSRPRKRNQVGAPAVDGRFLQYASTGSSMRYLLACPAQ
jgi:hypothetical protein